MMQANQVYYLIVFLTENKSSYLFCHIFVTVNKANFLVLIVHPKTMKTITGFQLVSARLILKFYIFAHLGQSSARSSPIIVVFLILVLWVFH